MRLFGVVGGTKYQVRAAWLSPPFDIAISETLPVISSGAFWLPGSSETIDYLPGSVDITTDWLPGVSETVDVYPGSVDERV